MLFSSVTPLWTCRYMVVGQRFDFWFYLQTWNYLVGGFLSVLTKFKVADGITWVRLMATLQFTIPKTRNDVSVFLTFVAAILALVDKLLRYTESECLPLKFIFRVSTLFIVKEKARILWNLASINTNYIIKHELLNKFDKFMHVAEMDRKILKTVLVTNWPTRTKSRKRHNVKQNSLDSIKSLTHMHLLLFKWLSSFSWCFIWNYFPILNIQAVINRIPHPCKFQIRVRNSNFR